MTHSDNKLNVKEPHLISMMLLSVFATLGALVMTPSLPRMSDWFGTRIGTTQLAITLFLLGYAVGQLLYGPIANRYGRRTAFFIGIIIATIGSLLSILSAPFESFSLLLAGRFLEALGACAGLVVSVTVISDFYTPRGVRRIMSWIMLGFSIMPGIAIFVGGFIAAYLNWRYCFYFLLIYGLALTWPVWRLSETLQKADPDALKRKQVFAHYLAVFKNKRLLAMAACTGFSSACLYVYGAEGPFIGIHILGMNPAIFGTLALTPYLGALVGSLINSKLSDVNANRLLVMAFLFELIATLIMLFCFLSRDISIWLMILPMLLFCLGHAFLVPITYAKAMEDEEDKSNGAAVLGFIAVSMPVLITLLLSQIHIQKAWIMPVLFLISLCLMLIVYLGFANKTE